MSEISKKNNICKIIASLRNKEVNINEYDDETEEKKYIS
jgi:hypothetical protein